MDSFRPNVRDDAPALTETETRAAAADLKGELYPKVNRKFIDPAKPGEPKFALFSFVKAPNATADSDGCFGVAKIRGVFYTPQEANARAEEIVRDVDSANAVFTCLVGHPFALVPRGFSSDLNEVDLQRKTEFVIAQNVREQRDRERKEMEELKERKDRLMRDVDPDKEPDGEETYVEQRGKLAQLRYAIDDYAKKGEECVKIKNNVIKFLSKERESHPEYERDYMQKYMDARRAAHIPEDTDMVGFMKYIALPIED